MKKIRGGNMNFKEFRVSNFEFPNTLKFEIKNSKFLFAVALILVFGLAGWIRIHNWITYTTWWADDGGGHLAYVEVIQDESRLPTTQETYLAWHEPGYYWLLAQWNRFAAIFPVSQLQWMEFSQLLLSLGLVVIVGFISWKITKDRFLTTVQLLVYSVLFVGVKLSAYVTNEVLAQLGMIYLTWWFLSLKLHTNVTLKNVGVWALLLGLLLYIKLTPIILLIAAIIFWIGRGIYTRKKEWFFAMIFLIGILFFVQAPWLHYKYQNFGSVFSINIYEQENKQNIIGSDGWGYLFSFSTKPYTTSPYWESKPWSFTNFLIADATGDFYNLFNHVDLLNALPAEEKIETSNGRFVTPHLFAAQRRTNITGVLLFVTWMIGVVGYAYTRYKKHEITIQDLWIYLIIAGGVGALVYNTLRHPFYERGVLKMQFVYFVLPFVSLLAYQWWAQALRKPFFRAVIILLPMVLYLVVAWPILFV